MIVGREPLDKLHLLNDFLIAVKLLVPAFNVQGSGFRVQGSGCRVQGLGTNRPTKF